MQVAARCRCTAAAPAPSLKSSGLLLLPLPRGPVADTPAGDECRRKRGLSGAVRGGARVVGAAASCAVVWFALLLPSADRTGLACVRCCCCCCFVSPSTSPTSTMPARSTSNERTYETRRGRDRRHPLWPRRRASRSTGTAADDDDGGGGDDRKRESVGSGDGLPGGELVAPPLLRPGGDPISDLGGDPATSRRGFSCDRALGLFSTGGCEAGDGGGGGGGTEMGTSCASQSNVDSPSRETVKRPKARRPEATTCGTAVQAFRHM